MIVKNTTFLSSVEDLKKLKNAAGGDIQVWGSGQLIQLLLQHDLVDELRLKIYPLILGEGKRLFENGVPPKSFKVTNSQVTSTGVIITTYQRAGDVVTGEIKLTS